MRRPVIGIPLSQPVTAEFGSGDSGSGFNFPPPRHARDAHRGDGFDTWMNVLGFLRARHPNKTAELVASWTGHSLRTVYRWMAGEAIPGADVTFDLITNTGHGPAIIELIARDLPKRQRLVFYRDLLKVAERGELQARLDLLDE